MARNLDPKCRQCRREGEKLFLKGEKCFTDKCAIEKRNYPPGQHGQRRSSRLSDYGVQLREKQKLRRIYGIIEKQFRSYYAEADRKKGITGENLLQLLESRLDNVVYKMGLGASRTESRQIVKHNAILVNVKRVNIPSFRVKEGDIIEVREKSKQIAVVLEATQLPERDVPEYIEADHSKLSAKFVRTPNLGDVPYPVIMEPNLVIEYYAQN